MTAPLVERWVDVQDLRMQVLEQGRGPLVLLLHGFPSLPCMWKRSLAALALAGFRAVAPTQRGYGATGGADDTRRCSMLHLVGDMVALLDVLGEPQGVVVGHDWGAHVAWNCALLRSDRFRAVAALAAPFSPRSTVRPTERMRHFAGDGYFYVLHFQEPGAAEADFAEMGVERALRRIFHAASGDAPAERRWRPSGPRGTRLFEGTEDPDDLPPWLDPELVALHVTEFVRTGFTGALNWYRAMDLSWELTAPFVGLPVSAPALFMYGDRDPLVRHMHRAIVNLRRHVPRLKDTVVIEGAGHWVPLEAADRVNRRLVEFVEWQLAR
ncbi:MAG TPA: alpha/beta hydrolase [Polyangiaceae bacterium]